MGVKRVEKRFVVTEHYTGTGGMNPQKKVYKIKDLKFNTLSFASYKTKECAETICERKNSR